MKVHAKQIPPEGLHIEGEEDPAFLDLHDPDARPAGPVRYSLDVGLSDGGLFATGTLDIEFEFRCVSCLESFRRQVSVNAFAVQTELAGPELVDLTPFVREDILLALPLYPRCDWQGEKTCEGVQVENAGDEKTQGEPAAGQSRAWDELDKLNVENDK